MVDIDEQGKADRAVTPHLLLVTIGPVQDFIVQARRTRDLWFGSHLLSELSRAAARTLAVSGHLVFPAIDADDPELLPCDAPIRSTGQPPLPISNRIVVELGTEVDPRSAAEQARTATQGRLQHIAEHVRVDRVRGLLAPGIDHVWNEQIANLLEFSATWTPIDSMVDGYSRARHQVEAASAARKGLRDFEPWRRLRGGVPKSSLDGARETVLAEPKDRDRRAARRFRIEPGEQLDAVGLVKRAGGEPEQFVPLANVAFAAWLTNAARVAPNQMAELRRACAEAGVPRVERGIPWVSDFRFDAQILLPERCAELLANEGEPAPEPARAWTDAHVRPLLAAVRAAGGRAPYPYVACLVADGDRVGETLDTLREAGQHREFSRGLALFASDARAIVEHKHRGMLVFAGGDDVTAFVTLVDALACAQALRDAFERRLRSTIPAQVACPTLSVGIGVVHVLEHMGHLLDVSRAAERAAKINRNSLAIAGEKRAGATVTWAESWTRSPVAKIGADHSILGGALSRAKLHEIDHVLSRFPAPRDAEGTGAGGSASWARILHDDIRYVLTRSQGKRGVTLEEAGVDGLGAEPASYGDRLEAIARWRDRLFIARLFIAATAALPPIEKGGGVG